MRKIALFLQRYTLYLTSAIVSKFDGKSTREKGLKIWNLKVQWNDTATA